MTLHCLWLMLLLVNSDMLPADNASVDSSRYPCSYCPQKLSKKNALNRHIARYHAPKKYACTKCPKRFGFEPDLKTHKKSHFRRKLYRCELCNRHFTTRGPYTAHLRGHAPVKACFICGIDFADTKSLRRHRRTVHQKKRPFQCEVCAVSFGAKQTLVGHKKIHNPLRGSYRCLPCQAFFSTKLNLTLHQHYPHCKAKNGGSGPAVTLENNRVDASSSAVGAVCEEVDYSLVLELRLCASSHASSVLRCTMCQQECVFKAEQWDSITLCASCVDGVRMSYETLPLSPQELSSQEI